MWKRAAWLMILALAPCAGFARCRLLSRATPSAQRVRLVIQSDLEIGPTTVEVLTPPKLSAATRVLYLLPVEPEGQTHYGDPIDEASKLDLAARWNLLCVSPGFSALPWYADHPTDKSFQQERYFIEDVLPLVSREFPGIPAKAARLLAGFSKSGWGALSLLLRHPGLFDGAAAWDAPLAKDQPDQWGMPQIFATQSNFEKYRISNLLDEASPQALARKRIVLSGYANFRDDMEQAHQRMLRLGIRHIYEDGPERRHSWTSGWLERIVLLLAGGG